MRAQDEDELDRAMARLADGDRGAFDVLFRALHPRALRLARARLGDAAAADAAQSALMKVFARAAEFRAGAPVLPWFYAIVANETRALLRASKARASRSADGDTDATLALDVATTDDPERLLLERELAGALEAAIANLDDASAHAIAALLGRAPPPAVAAPALRKRISRAYARLRLVLVGPDLGERNGD